MQGWQMMAAETYRVLAGFPRFSGIILKVLIFGVYIAPPIMESAV